MYDTSDPRSQLSPPSTHGVATSSLFAAAEYGKFYEMEPRESGEDFKTWYFRGQNMIVAYTDASTGSRFERSGQPDEYMILLPDPQTVLEITSGSTYRNVDGFSLTIVPPGDSAITVASSGRVIRLFTTQSLDLCELCANNISYSSPHPHVTPFASWPESTKGDDIRAYSLDVPHSEGRFGRIWRCSTFMVNYSEPRLGPRDVTKMSPHSHDDFEQLSLAIEGEFVHHIRWPWVPDMTAWREDEHELCASPSAAVIPPPAIHTSEQRGQRDNQLIDVFCPPRLDFSERPGWVLNADEYPMPD